MKSKIRASKEDLERCRRDPSLADKLRPDLVLCLECGDMVARLIQSNCHARREHGLDRKSYLKTWPGAPLASVEASEADRKARKTYRKTHRSPINKQRRDRYAEILKLATANPAGQEAAFIKKNHDRSSANWKKLYWGKGPKDKTAAEFRQGESARRSSRHGDKENKASRDRYHRNIETERAKNAEKQRKIRKLAWRPDGWKDKPISWRIIGTELLSEEGYITNREIATRLDRSDILRCPYGATWVSALDHRSFIVFMSTVRKWVNKPGKEGGAIR